MRFDIVARGIQIADTYISKINIENSIVYLNPNSKKTLGVNIGKPRIKKIESGYFAAIIIDLMINIDQGNNEILNLSISSEGHFVSTDGVSENEFRSLVAINGAAALIGIVRGKIESITANIMSCGKVTIPFVNVVDYYNENSNVR